MASLPPINEESYSIILEASNSTDAVDNEKIMETISGSISLRSIVCRAFEELRNAGLSEFTIVFKKDSSKTGTKLLSADFKELEIYDETAPETLSRIVLISNETLVPRKVESAKFIEVLCPFALTLQHDLNAKKKRRLPNFESKYFFDSNVFLAFREQVKAFTKSLLEKYPKVKSSTFIHSLIKLTEKKDGDRCDHENIFNIVQDFLYALDECIAPGDDKDALTTFIQEWCRDLYTTVRLESDWQVYLCKHLPEIDIDKSTDIKDFVTKATANITKGSHFLPLVANTAVSDNVALGNVPSICWTYQKRNGKEAQFVRTPTVALQNNYDDELYIQPEFIQFLKALQLQGKKFVYFNLMNTRVVGPDSNLESVLSKLLHDLKVKHGLTNFIVVSLDRNSDFYLGMDVYDGAKHPEIAGLGNFIPECFRNLFNVKGEQPCVWPADYEISVWMNMAQKIIQKVQAQYFPNLLVYNQVQRNVFNELMNKEFVSETIELTDCDYYTIACYSSIDRGPSLQAVHYWDGVLKRGEQHNPSEILRTTAILLVNALLNQGRLPHDTRINTFLETLKVMESAAAPVATTK